MSFEYKTLFTATQYVTPVAGQVSEGLWQVKWSAEDTGQSLERMGTSGARGFQMLIFSGQMALFYTSMLMGGMMRNESATIAVEMAQDRYNETIRKFGPQSQEATRALQQLERSQIYYQRSAMYSNIMTISMGLQMVSFGVSIVRYAVPALTSLTVSLHGVAAAFSTLYAAMGPWGLALLGITAAVGIGAGVYYATRPVEMPSTINVNSKTDMNEALDEWNRRAKRQLSQAGVP